MEADRAGEVGCRNRERAAEARRKNRERGCGTRIARGKLQQSAAVRISHSSPTVRPGKPAEALAVVNVGKSEWLFRKFTPASRKRHAKISASASVGDYPRAISASAEFDSTQIRAPRTQLFHQAVERLVSCPWI